MISDGTTAVQAFEAGEVDVHHGLPPDEIPRLKETPEYEQYPGARHLLLRHQRQEDHRREPAQGDVAGDRPPSIIDNIAQAGPAPATGFTPKGMPGFDVINPESPWMPEEGDMEQAKQLMSEVANPVNDITLYVNDSPGHREIAVAIQAAWKELGINATIKQQEFQQYLEFLGPPPNQDVDVYRLGWIGDFVDAINFLDLWTCESGNNKTNYCNKEYDALIEKAKQHRTTTPATSSTPRRRTSSSARTATCRSSRSTTTPTRLENESVKESFERNLLNQADLTKVVVTE